MIGVEMRATMRGSTQTAQNLELLAQKMNSVLSAKNAQSFGASARLTLCVDNVIYSLFFIF